MPGPWEKYQKPGAAAGADQSGTPGTAVQPTDVQQNGGAPWMRYQAPPAAQAATPPAGKASPSGLTKLQDSFDRNTQSSPTEPLLETGLKSVVGAVGSPFVHPLDTAVGIAHMLRHPIDQVHQEVNQLYDDKKAGGLGYAATKFGGQALGGTIMGELGGEATGAAGRGLKRAVTGDVNAVPAGSTISPAQRYRAAQRVGVKLDAADATGSPLLGNVKRVGENSLAGGHVYDQLKAANTGALQNSTDSLLDKMYRGDRESGGAAILDALKQDHTGLRNAAESGFKMLTDQTAGKPVKGAPAVGQSAESLLKEIEPLARKYPSLAPAKTLEVLRDLSGVGKAPKPQTVGFLDAPGSEFAVPQKPSAKTPDTWENLQRLRSATHDLTLSSPDLVKSQAVAPLQRMTEVLDDGMTNGASGLTPAQEAIFRQSNAQWKDMKETYDNPSSPFYHAVRTDSPSTLFGGVGPKTPENALNLRSRLSPPEVFSEAPSPALGAVRRGTVEGALKTNNEGAPNFRTFGTQWNRVPADYRANLFSPDQNAALQDIMHTSNALSKDFNPSGSGKLVQKASEGGGLLLGAGEALMGSPKTLLAQGLYHAGQYGAAKLLTNPRAVEWLMRPGVAVNRAAIPAAAAATTAAPKRGDLFMGASSR